jgi:predicted RND superfamily exporter protein
MFRSVQGLLLPMAAVAVSLVWTTGILAAIGAPIGIITSIFPTVLIVYGVVDPLFVFTRYLGKLQRGRTRHEAVLEALSELLLPCFLTSLTTALGFAAFVTATLSTIRVFGLVVAIGVSLSFVTTITVLPLLLVSVPAPKQQTAPPWIASRLDAGFVALANFVRARRGLVFAGAAAFIALGAVAGAGLRIVNTYVGSLPRGEELTTLHDLEDRLSGVVRLIVYVEGKPGDLKRPEVLQAMETIVRDVSKEEDVTSSSSLSTLVADVNQAFEGGDVAARRVPSSAALIAQYMTMIDPTDLGDLVNGDYSHGQMVFLVRDHGSPAVWHLCDVIKRDTDRYLRPLGVNPQLTGATIAYHEIDEMVREVLLGFVYAFAIIVALEWVMFRSLRIALLSVIPNLIPVGACFIAMRALGLDLRIESSLVLCVSIGGLFNTTIHIIARVLQQARAGAKDIDAMIEAALRTVGPPSFYTAAVLSAGLAVMAISRFQGLQIFGLLSTLTFVAAFFADSLITPALMRFMVSPDALRTPAEAEGASGMPTLEGRPGE